jgi:ribosomal 30S subunit maturation factor RimM
LHTGANDVYIIETPDGSFMVPAIKDVVLKINIAEKKIILRLLDGLRELSV